MNKRKFIQIALANAFLVGLVAPSYADDHGTPDEAKQMVVRAIEHIKKVGVDAAYEDFTNDKENWVKKDVYIFALTMKGHQLAHGTNKKQIGKEFWDFQDFDGKYVFREFAATAAKGGGWVDYNWAHPVTKKSTPKTSYIAKIPGADAYLGAGAYK